MYPFVQALDLAWNACKELKDCNKFVAVLRYVLAVGNYLNAGSNKGNAYGFSLNTLTKVSAVFTQLICFPFTLRSFLSLFLTCSSQNFVEMTRSCHYCTILSSRFTSMNPRFFSFQQK